MTSKPLTLLLRLPERLLTNNSDGGFYDMDMRQLGNGSYLLKNLQLQICVAPICIPHVAMRVHHTPEIGDFWQVVFVSLHLHSYSPCALN